MKDYSILSNVKEGTIPTHEFVETDTWWFYQDWHYSNKPIDVIKKEFEIVPYMYSMRSSYRPEVLFFPFIYKNFSVKIIPEQHYIN